MKLKNIFFSALFSILSTQAMAVNANDMRFTQRDSGNTANIARDISFPSSAANGIFVFNGSTVLPQAATLSGGLVFDGTNLTTSAIPQANISGLSTSLAGKFDLPTGSTAQYLRGDGSLATFPTSTVSSFNGRTGTVLPAANDYAVSDVNGLTSALAGKVVTTTTVNGHALSGNVTVTKSDVGLGNVDNTADASKAFTAAQTTSGTFADARIAQSNVTQYQSALSIASNQVTGTKTSSFISDFGTASRAANQMYSSTTQKLGAFPIFKSGTVASGAVTFQLTADGTSTGSALFPNGPDMSSFNFYANDSGNLYTYSLVLSNSNKTVTVTAKKLNLLALGLANASDGLVVYLSVWGN